MVPRARTAGKKPPFWVPMRISFGLSSARSGVAPAITAVDANDSFRKSRRFIDLSDHDCASTLMQREKQ
jgi:hypothetical protein